MNRHKINDFGFTLVELIIVITILAILSAIAFISFQGYTKSSRDSNRLATLKNIDT
jgi:prepilin-type N-terminal cleavage/methylation domain-containing protein